MKRFATGNSQLLCKLFSGETVTLTYATEKCRVIKKNTPFSIIGSTQLPMLTKIECGLDQGQNCFEGPQNCAQGQGFCLFFGSGAVILQKLPPRGQGI